MTGAQLISQELSKRLLSAFVNKAISSLVFLTVWGANVSNSIIGGFMRLENAEGFNGTKRHAYVYIHTYIHTYVQRERGRENWKTRERERERTRKLERERERVCISAHQRRTTKLITNFCLVFVIISDSWKSVRSKQLKGTDVVQRERERDRDRDRDRQRDRDRRTDRQRDRDIGEQTVCCCCCCCCCCLTTIDKATNRAQQ